jgi:hypothetical protein
LDRGRATDGGIDTIGVGVIIGRNEQDGPTMTVPFAPGPQSHNSGSHEQPPASHVGRPHPSHPSSAGRLTLTVADRSADVLPEQVRPKGEPTEASDGKPTGKARRKGPRRRGR